MAGLVVASLALLCVGASPAQAGKAVVGAIGDGTPGALGGEFNRAFGLAPPDVAVSQATGDVYVAEAASPFFGGNRRVQQFDASGEFVRAWGKDVDAADPSTGIEVCVEAEDCKAGSVGGLGGEFNNPSAVAVDAAGAVWVADGSRIQKFDADGQFLLALGRDVDAGNPGSGFEVCAVASQCKRGVTGPGAGELGSFLPALATGPGGDLYVADASNRRVQRFDGTTGQFEIAFGWNVDPADGGGQLESCSAVCQAGTAGDNPGQFMNNTPKSLAVDPGGFVYTVGSARVQRFRPDLAGAVVLFAPGDIGGGFAVKIAVDPGGDLYVANNRGEVSQFGFGGDLLDIHGAGAGLVNPAGIAVDATGGNLYVAALNRIFILNEPSPPTATIQPPDQIEAHSATPRGLVNPNGFTTGYHFEYSSDGENWTSTPATDADAGGGSSPVAVSVEVEGLVANRTYRVRLVATKAFGGGSATSEEESFTTAAAPPVVSGTGVVNLGDTEATLVGRVHPENDRASYRFEYGRSTEYGSSVPIPDGDLPPSARAVKVAQALPDLTPDVTYHARLVATNSAGTTEGPDTSFQTLVAPPAGRAYELVSPADKGVGEVDGSASFGHLPMAAGDGRTAVFTSEIPFGDLEGAGLVNPYRSTRDQQEGWSTEPLNVAKGPPETINDIITENRYVAYSSDLSFGILNASHNAPPLAEGAAEGTNNIYLRSFDPTEFELVTPGLPDGAGGDAVGSPVVSADGRKVAFSSSHQLGDAPGPPPAGQHLYLWDRRTGEVSFASRLPDGSVSPDSVKVASPHQTVADPGALSRDGSRLFFESPMPIRTRRLYMRENLTETTLVSQEESSSADPAGRGQFWAASEDGSRVYFASPDQLVDADPDAGGVTPTSGGWDLYLYTHSDDPASDQNLTLVSTDEEPADGNEASVLGVLGASDDGQRVYFAAEGQLVAGEPTEPGLKLYFWDATGAEPALTYVGLGNTLNVESVVAQRTARVSPTGRHLAFESSQDLTDFESDGHNQVYLYDAESDQLRCASCSPTGEPPESSAQFSATGPTAGDERIATPPGGWVSRNLSADGGRLFFETPEALLPQDSNDSYDVYLLEDGRLSLISTGAGPGDAHFADAGTDGDDVFFTTRERLVAGDRDNARDLYDARVGGGFPEPPAPASCEGAACRGLPAPPPLAHVPASMALARGGGQPPSGSPPPSSRRCGKLKRRAERKLTRAKRLQRKVKRARRADHRRRTKRLRKKARRAREGGRKARKNRAPGKRLRKKARRAREGGRKARKNRPRGKRLRKKARRAREGGRKARKDARRCRRGTR